MISDISGDPRIPLAAYQPTFVKSLAMAPVGLPEPIAAIGAYWAVKRRPTDEEVRALETMARAASVAMQNVRLTGALNQALSDAQAAEAAKDAFLANMSRELRGSLGGLSVIADLLSRTQLDPRQQQLCAVLKTSSEDVVQLVCDVLDFARLEAGRANFYHAKFDLAASIEAAAAPISARAAERGLSFDLRIAETARRVFLGDETRLKQIVHHLAANAVKFTDAGGVVISVEEEERVGPRSMFKISVSDTGLGFDAENSGALFESFSQGATAEGRGAARAAG